MTNNLLPGVDDDELLAVEKLVQGFSDVRRNHLFGLLVVLVHQSIGPNVFDDLFRVEASDAVEPEAIDKTDAGAFKNLEPFEQSTTLPFKIFGIVAIKAPAYFASHSLLIIR